MKGKFPAYMEDLKEVEGAPLLYIVCALSIYRAIKIVVQVVMNGLSITAVVIVILRYSLFFI